MIFERHANLKYKYGNRHFWCRGYYVDTVGKNAKKIQEYIQNQLKEDLEYDQMTLKEYVDPFTGEPVKQNNLVIDRTVAVTVLANLCDLQQHAATLQPCAYRKYFQRNALYSQIFSKGSRIDISAFSSECIDFFLRQQTYLSVPVTSMRITLDSLVRTQPCGIQRFFLRASFFADTDGCNCACLYCLFHHYPPICTICLFSVIFSLVSKQCICGFARITRCSSSRICS